ncbi:MAG: hypothetical protein JXJ04_04325 [Spirochaetales bacterium]|nr:hypothetical protein [Spirochaetales bacterium]
MAKSLYNRVLQIIILILICSYGFAKGAGERSLKLSPAQKNIMHRLIAEHDAWFGKEYVLEFLEEWDNARLPIVLAIPAKLLVDYSPCFAIMPDNRVLSAYEKDAFKTIIKEVFPDITEADAPLIAELSIMFGGFGAYVGVIYDGMVKGRSSSNRQLRSTSDIYYKKQGENHRIEFYSYDYELLLMYDCRISITHGEITTEFSKIEEDS